MFEEGGHVVPSLRPDSIPAERISVFCKPVVIMGINPPYSC